MTIEVSVVIPIKDDTDLNIDNCLSSLEKQDFSGSFEVIVVSGGNIAQARNFGIKQAKGEIVAFIDSDCVAPDNWLTNLIKSLRENPNVGGVGGTNFSPVNGPFLGRAIDFVYSSYLGSLDSASLHGPKSPKCVDSLACINSAFWYKVLHKINGFSEEYDLSEDTVLGFKTREAGYPLLFNPEIFVWHYRRDTIKRFSKQFFLYGSSESRSIITDKKYARRLVIIPFTMSILFPFFAFLFPLPSLLVVLTYFVATFSIGINAVLKTKKKHLFFLIPSLFLVEHFSYFFGMIHGFSKGKWVLMERKCQVFKHLTKTKSKSTFN
jgi:GT2 family glycosyltransferase